MNSFILFFDSSKPLRYLDEFCGIKKLITIPKCSDKLLGNKLESNFIISIISLSKR